MSSKELKKLIADGREAVLAGRLDDAEALKAKAVALKSIEDLETPDVPTGVQRLPFGTDPATPPPAAEEATFAMKSWYVKKFGALDTGMEQVTKELYGANVDYQRLAFVKHADFRRFLKYGVADPDLSRMLLLTPEQILDAVASGVSVREIKATQVESNDTLGGYLVPEDFRTSIISRLPGSTVVRSRANVITTSSDRVTMPKAKGGNDRYPGNVRITWVEETPTANASATNALWGNINIPINTVMAKTSLSRNLVEDSAFPVESYLGDQFTGAMAIDEDEQFLIGPGLGKPLGILPGGLMGTGVDADITFYGTGGAAITADAIVKAPYKLAAQYRQSGPVWVMNKDSVAFTRGLKDSANRYLWSDNIQNLASGQNALLNGYSVAESEAMPSAASNAFPIIFGDFKGYMIADRVGMVVERYLDSTTADTNTIVFMARRRLGGQVTEGWRFVPIKCA